MSDEVNEMSAASRGSAAAEWIPVTERLPGKDEEGGMPNVLGYYPEYPPDIQLVWYTGDHWEDGEGSGQEMKSPTHWMPLPAPPTGDK